MVSGRPGWARPRGSGRDPSRVVNGQALLACGMHGVDHRILGQAGSRLGDGAPKAEMDSTVEKVPLKSHKD